MDTLIFILIFAVFVAMWRGKRAAAGLLLALAFIAVALLFKHHATDALAISL
jgi:hypothetical protein